MSKEIDVIIPHTEVTEEEKTAFFKAFLADKPFTATDSMLDGAFTVEFQSLSVQQSTDIFDQLRRDQQKQLITNDSTYMMALTNYRLAQAIVSIGDKPFQPEFSADKYKPVDDSDSYIKAKAAILKTWSIFKLSAIAEAFKGFEDKILFLTKEIQSENFWKAAK